MSSPAEPAARHFFIVVEPRRARPATLTVRWLWSFLAAFVFGDVGGPSLAQVVLRRRSTRGEALRLDVADDTEADRLVERLEEDLERFTLEEFSGEWNVPSGK